VHLETGMLPYTAEFLMRAEGLDSLPDGFSKSLKRGAPRVRAPYRKTASLFRRVCAGARDLGVLS
jgi:hypothetical protein